MVAQVGRRRRIFRPVFYKRYLEKITRRCGLNNNAPIIKEVQCSSDLCNTIPYEELESALEVCGLSNFLGFRASEFNHNHSTARSDMKVVELFVNYGF
jgi:hypothetical protein